MTSKTNRGRKDPLYTPPQAPPPSGGTEEKPKKKSKSKNTKAEGKG